MKNDLSKIHPELQSIAKKSPKLAFNKWTTWLINLMMSWLPAPKILDERGQEVYGSAYVSREYAVQQGMAGYAKDLTASQTNPRVTDRPLTVKSLKTEGAGQSDLIISNADADMIRGASENLSFLKQCRVMIVVD